jgi:hypothetical protein
LIFALQKLLGTAAHFRKLQIFTFCKMAHTNIKAIRAYSAFADHQKAVKRHLAS